MERNACNGLKVEVLCTSGPSTICILELSFEHATQAHAQLHTRNGMFCLSFQLVPFLDSICS